MSQIEAFPLRWHGQESGPFPLRDLERQLEDGQLCLWHEVQVQDRWITLDELLRSRAPSTPVPETKAGARAAAASPEPSPGPSTGKRYLPRLHPRPSPGAPPSPPATPR